MLFSVDRNDTRKYVCVRRLLKAHERVILRKLWQQRVPTVHCFPMANVDRLCTWTECDWGWRDVVVKVGTHFIYLTYQCRTWAEAVFLLPCIDVCPLGKLTSWANGCNISIQQPSTLWNSTRHIRLGTLLHDSEWGWRGSPIGFSGSGIWLIWRPGFGNLEERESDFRDCNYERDTSLSGFTMRDSGNGVVKNRYPVTKSEKSFHFDLTLVAHISAWPCQVPLLTVPLFSSHHFPLVHWRWGKLRPL